jgi:quinol monooxygenase YgiN
MIIVTGTVMAKSDSLQELLKLCVEHVHRSRLEPGCLMHSVHQDVEDPNRVVFLEKWVDLDALRTHFGVEAGRAFARSLGALSTEPSTLEIYEAVATAV